MNEQNNQNVNNPEPITQNVQTTQPPNISAQNIPNLTPSDPGHPKYDPLKDPRVKEYTDRILSNMAQKDGEKQTLQVKIDEMKEKLSSFEKEKKEKEDAEKSEIQRVTDRIAELEKQNTSLESQLNELKNGHNKEKVNLNARYLIMKEIAKAGIKINNAEQRGLIQELEDKLSNMSESDKPDDIATSIIATFAEERKVNFTPPPSPELIRPDQSVEQKSLEKELVDLSKGEMTPEKEARLKVIMKQLDKKQK